MKFLIFYLENEKKTAGKYKTYVILNIPAKIFCRSLPYFVHSLVMCIHQMRKLNNIAIMIKFHN